VPVSLTRLGMNVPVEEGAFWLIPVCKAAKQASLVVPLVIQLDLYF